MSPVRTKKTKPAPERAEEPVEPVKATEHAPADHAATDALLDTIEALLDPATEEETKRPAWMTNETFRLMLADFDPARDTLQFLPRSRTEGDQAKLYEEYVGATGRWAGLRDAVEVEQFERERNQTPTEDDFDIPWAEIARMPDPGPGGTTVEVMEPQEINWAESGDDPTRFVVRPRTRVLHVTRAMWEQARRGVMVFDRFDRPQRYRGDGLCPRCGWPIAGPGRYPCDGSAPPNILPPDIRPPVLDPKAAIRITNC